MDPDECLTEIRDLLKRIEMTKKGGRLRPGVSREYHEGLLEELAERVDALDVWLTGGGFPPAAWRKTAL